MQAIRDEASRVIYTMVSYALQYKCSTVCLIFYCHRHRYLYYISLKITKPLFAQDYKTFKHLKVLVEKNNQIIRELKKKNEENDRTLKELAMDRFCLAFLNPRTTKSSERG